MIATFLTTPELLAEHWDSVALLIQPVIDHAAKGEFTLQDVEQLVQQRRATAAIAHLDGKPVIAMVFEFRYYPSKTCINVLALGGSGLGETAKQFLPTFLQWALQYNVTEIEASASLAMSKLLERIGFIHTYNLLRLPC